MSTGTATAPANTGPGHKLNYTPEQVEAAAAIHGNRLAVAQELGYTGVARNVSLGNFLRKHPEHKAAYDRGAARFREANPDAIKHGGRKKMGEQINELADQQKQTEYGFVSVRDGVDVSIERTGSEPTNVGAEALTDQPEPLEQIASANVEDVEPAQAIREPEETPSPGDDVAKSFIDDVQAASDEKLIDGQEYTIPPAKPVDEMVLPFEGVSQRFGTTGAPVRMDYTYHLRRDASDGEIVCGYKSEPMEAVASVNTEQHVTCPDCLAAISNDPFNATADDEIDRTAEIVETIMEAHEVVGSRTMNFTARLNVVAGSTTSIEFSRGGKLILGFEGNYFDLSPAERSLLNELTERFQRYPEHPTGDRIISDVDPSQSIELPKKKGWFGRG